MNIAQIKRRRRFLFLLLGIFAFSLSGTLVLLASRDSLVYFYTPTELLKINNVEGKLIRIGGLVEIDTLKRKGDLTINFIVDDGQNKIEVEYIGILPDLFREGQGVICEGKITGDNVFLASKILAKHDENYMPPEIAEALKKSGKWREGEKFK